MLSLQGERERGIIGPKEEEMKDSILVVYASKRGATKEIAEKVAQVLEVLGLNVELLAAAQAGNPSPYKAVILGSAV